VNAIRQQGQRAGDIPYHELDANQKYVGADAEIGDKPKLPCGYLLFIFVH
jgi:hypothetical protein